MQTITRLSPLERQRNQERDIENSISQIHIVSDLMGTVARHPVYREYSKSRPMPDAYLAAVHDLTETNELELSSADNDLLAVTGQLGYFIQAQKKLSVMYDEARGQRFNDADWRTVCTLKKEHIIPFNHCLKEFINTHPECNIDTTSKNLSAAYNTVFSDQNTLEPGRPIIGRDKPTPSDTYYAIYDALNGMRHEFAAETLLEASRLDGIKYNYNTSVTDDSHGIDLLIKLPHRRWSGFDIKASETGVRNAKEKHPLSRAVATGFHDDDFTGQSGTRYDVLAVPFSTAEEKSDEFVARLYDTLDTYQSRKHRLDKKARKQAGKSAVAYYHKERRR